jgi:D-alanyl-D-alanine carboxypeptidase/D-alanyl-D-alanine-endopeptidase (penicillin-binding protein 4)
MNKLTIALFVLAALGSPACSPSHTTTGTTTTAAGNTATTPTATTAAASTAKATVAKDPLQQFTEETLLRQPGLLPAQVGICLFDPAKTSYLYNYQGDKYFIPASNTKLFSLYAGLKHLGDSLVGMRYRATDTALFIQPAGDPTLLHPDFPDQPVIRFLQKAGRNLYLTESNWQDRPFGRGWAWDDYNDDYAPERSAFPVYGNLIRWMQDTMAGSVFSIPEIDWPVRFSPDSSKQGLSVRRDYHANVFVIAEGQGRIHEQDVPFITDGVASAAVLLKDTVGRPVGLRKDWPAGPHAASTGVGVIRSRPVDSLFRPMMHNSDNFFAEQTLLMVGNEWLGKMNDGQTIDSLLNSDLKGLPQRPIWVDGSGLSRNDLFTPQDFIWLLDRLRQEFGLARMEGILPTCGKGTLSSYYKQDSGYIFAKTGSLSGVAALSGYLITKKDHLLLFSILINNYTGSGTAVRRQIEAWIHHIRSAY